MKMIIFKEFGKYYCATRENYFACIKDANKVRKLADFENPEQIIEYYCKYCGSSPTDFEVIIKKEEL